MTTPSLSPAKSSEILDGDKVDRWGTRLEQSRNRRGVKLSVARVRVIHASDQPDRKLAEKFGCVPGAIWNARNGLTWREVRP